MSPTDPTLHRRADAGVSGCFADRSAARLAIDMTLPMAEALARDRSRCGSGFLCIVVLDPTMAPTQARFDDAVLAEHAVGDRSRWDADYAAFARAKARLVWEHGIDGLPLQTASPHRLRAGDSLLRGGVCLDGIVVGVSGAFPWWDEAIGTAVAANLRAIAQQRHSEAIGRGLLVAPSPAHG
jgi:hypothetical protein